MCVRSFPVSPFRRSAEASAGDPQLLFTVFLNDRNRRNCLSTPAAPFHGLFKRPKPKELSLHSRRERALESERETATGETPPSPASDPPSPATDTTSPDSDYPLGLRSGQKAERASERLGRSRSRSRPPSLLRSLSLPSDCSRLHSRRERAMSTSLTSSTNIPSKVPANGTPSTTSTEGSCLHASSILIICIIILLLVLFLVTTRLKKIIKKRMASQAGNQAGNALLADQAGNVLLANQAANVPLANLAGNVP